MPQGAFIFRTGLLSSEGIPNLCEQCGTKLDVPRRPTCVRVIEAPEEIANVVRGKFFHELRCLHQWATQKYLDEEKAAKVFLPHFPESREVRTMRAKAFMALATYAKDASSAAKP